VTSDSQPKPGDKVLSIRQPYADFILCGTKWCENRTWRTQYRGALWIHASKLERRELQEWEEKGIDLLTESPFGLRTGAIIGRVQLIGCVDGDDLWEFHDAFRLSCILVRLLELERPRHKQEHRANGSQRGRQSRRDDAAKRWQAALRQ
jgi:hypothetical protein